VLREPTAPDCLSGPGPFVSHHAFRDTDNTEVMWLYLKSPSAVSGAPHAIADERLLSKRALLIQRLEGSRPDGSLCTLNRSDRVLRS
jgi:hypothetical protein